VGAASSFPRANLIAKKKLKAITMTLPILDDLLALASGVKRQQTQLHQAKSTSHQAEAGYPL
jgi:hypothetical protein